jgi:HPt (histidine-containing phosphotransfer) domain-containing protein
VSRDKNKSVKIDSDLREIVPLYLKNVKRDVIQMKEAARIGDFGLLGHLGHQMKGVASSYGFPSLAELGAALELSSLAREGSKVHELVSSISKYIDNIEITYD